MTPAEQERHEIFDQCSDRLTKMAERFVHVKQHHPSEGAMIAIHVDDPTWTELVELLMPGYDWQPYSDRGERPVARGSVMWGTVEVICSAVPDIAMILKKAPPSGHMYTLILAGGGVSVYAVPYGGVS